MTVVIQKLHVCSWMYVYCVFTMINDHRYMVLIDTGPSACSLSQYMRCGYEVPGVILLQASYLHTYSILRWVTTEVLPLSSYVLSPIMLPLWKNFWNSCYGTASGISAVKL